MGRRMFKLEEEILVPDRRFAALYGVNASGVSPITIADHYRHVDRVSINPVAPLEVRTSFDRARNVSLYAWFCYELLVVSELQAFGALELALKLRLLGPSQKISNLGSLLRLARKTGCCHPRWVRLISLMRCLLCAMFLLTAPWKSTRRKCRSPYCWDAPK